MADRGCSKARVRRAPLGDATDRIVNASPPKPGKGDKPVNSGPNPLRAHPVNVASSKIPLRKQTTYPSNDLGSKTGTHVTPSIDTPGVASGVHAAAPSANETHVNNRFSQISTSSGASGGNRKTHIGPWQLGKTLGKGSAARVRLARHRTTQDVVAVKILAKNATQLAAAGSMAELDKWDRTRDEFNSQRQMPLTIEREVAVLKLIDHPHIVKLHDIWENRAEIYLVLEYMDGGDMFSYIDMYGPLPEFETVGYFRQLVAALEYVHSFNICHRDLKPENILMKSNGVVKIADFGMAAIQQSPTHALRTSCGSPHYAAPELIARVRYQGDKVDIWSMGCLLYVALCRRLPFDDPDGNVPRLLAKAQRGIYQVPHFLSKEARDLIARMLTVDPLKRIPIRRIWQHPLVRKYDDLDDLNDGGRALNSRVNDRSKPVAPEELDLQTLRQLKSIWHTFSEKQISMQLSNSQPNDQKLFYWLLLSYREKKLENYDTDLTCSPSDYHHLRPTNWKKKFTTAEFPSKYGRTPSRFTVISTVPTDGSIEEADNITDSGRTILSYDPYKSSRIIENAYASHAKIVIHRNGSAANNSSRGQVSSFRSSSARSRQARGGRRIAAPTATRTSRHSLSSIQSGESIPYTRSASRRKRGINFQHTRMQPGGQHEVPRVTASTIAEDRSYTSPVCPGRLVVEGDTTPETLNERNRAGTQSTVNMSQADQSFPYWNEEVREFSNSIARDCDDAFNSSLLDAESYLGNTPKEASDTADVTPISNILATPTPAPSKHVSSETHPWDHRPLPPTPSTTASSTREIRIGKTRASEQHECGEVPVHTNSYTYRAGVATLKGVSSKADDPSRRISSAPIYSQYSTQRGKDQVPLTSINEKLKEESYGDASDKYRIVSAPAQYGKSGSVQTDDNTGYEYLSRQDNTIRLVTSPSSKAYTGIKPPESPDAWKRISRSLTTHTQPKQELNLRQRYMNDEPAVSSMDAQALPDDFPSSTGIKKKSSWFKRGPKDREDIFYTKLDPASSRPERLMHTTTNSSGASGNYLTKKKSFNLAFWRNSKHEPQINTSCAGSETERMPSPKRARMFRHKGRQRSRDDREDQAGTRNIKPQQNWIARLFRVKPATKYLCFSISRRRARQETANLLKEWRKYGIRDVEIDKERNIVFARLGRPNYLDLKEVAFAVEIMTVVEHGKRGRLCIARFTQERGAASSFHKVVDTMNSVFKERNLLVDEKRKVKMMIKTLNA